MLVKVQPFKVEVTAYLATQNQLVNWVSESSNRTQPEPNQIGALGLKGRQHG